jgi:hypothetical protein
VGTRAGIGWTPFDTTAGLFACTRCLGVFVAAEHRALHDADVHGWETEPTAPGV